MTDDIDTLISSYLDGSMNGPALADFNRRVATDPAFAGRLYQIAHLHGSLRELGTVGPENLWGGSAAPADGIDVPLPIQLPALADGGVSRERGRKNSAGAFIAAGLFFAIGAMLLYVVWPKNAASLAIITQARNVWVVREGNQIAASPNMELRPGDSIRTANNGSASVVFGENALKLEVEGDAHVTLPESGDSRQLQLEQGVVSVTVDNKAAQPFTVATPQGDVKMDGTQATIAASSTETRLDVHDGTVNFTRKSDGKAVKVAHGQYAIAGSAVEMAALPFATPANEKEDKEPEVASKQIDPAPAKQPAKEEPLKPWEMNITTFHVLDAATGEVIPEMSPLTYGTQIEKRKFPKGFTIKAATSPDKIGSILYQLNGQRIYVANNPPYAVTDAKGKGFEGLDLPPGMYNLRATPFTKPDGKGKPGPFMVVRFQVVRPKGKNAAKQ